MTTRYIDNSLQAKTQKHVSSRLRKFRASIAKLRAGTSNARVLLIGDSITIGIDVAGNGYRPNEGKAVANYLNSARGFHAHDDAFVGFSAAGNGSRLLHDIRVSGAGTTSSVMVMGGYMGQIAAAPIS